MSDYLVDEKMVVSVPMIEAVNRIVSVAATFGDVLALEVALVVHIYYLVGQCMLIYVPCMVRTVVVVPFSLVVGMNLDVCTDPRVVFSQAGFDIF